MEGILDPVDEPMQLLPRAVNRGILAAQRKEKAQNGESGDGSVSQPTPRQSHTGA
jgi:hypothetical protein